MRGLRDNISPVHFVSGIAQFLKCGCWLIHKAMISILAQERVLGAALGIALTGALVFDERRFIYKTTAHNQPPSSSSQMKASTSGKKIDFAHYWNKSVDRIFGPAIQAVSSQRS